MHVDDRRSVIPQVPSTLESLFQLFHSEIIIITLFFLFPGLSLPWNSPSRLDWLAKNYQTSLCLCLPALRLQAWDTLLAFFY